MTGCLRTSAFHCASDAECTPDGTCEAIGFCSFPDQDCESGARFGTYSDDHAGQCVDRSAAPDGGVDAPAACPATYSALPNAGMHVYRRIANGAPWTAQRDACAGDGGYLVIPDAAPELGAVVALAAGAELWVGVSDRATEGAFVTVRGAPAAFLPWESGEPNNAPGEGDCVRSKPTALYADDRCSSSRPAVCECEP